MCNQVMASSFGKSTTARKFLKTILRVQNSVKESEHIVYNTSIPFKGQKAILEERNNIWSIFRYVSRCTSSPDDRVKC